MAEPGWYRVDGDPPGTMRRWNGEHWVGVPVIPEEGPGAVAGSMPATPLTRLTPSGEVKAVFTVALFAVQAIALGWLGLKLHRAVDTVPEKFGIEGVADLGKYIPDISWHVAALLGLALVGASFFGAWLNDVVLATGALSGAQMRRTGIGGGSTASILMVFLVLGAFLGAIFVLFRSRSPRNARQVKTRPNLMNILNLVIERVNRAGGRPIGPIKVLIWWVLLWGTIIVGTGTWIWTASFGSDNRNAIPNAVRVYEILAGLGVVSLIAIMGTVMAITARLR